MGKYDRSLGSVQDDRTPSFLPLPSIPFLTSAQTTPILRSGGISSAHISVFPRHLRRQPLIYVMSGISCAHMSGLSPQILHSACGFVQDDRTSFCHSECPPCHPERSEGSVKQNIKQQTIQTNKTQYIMKTTLKSVIAAFGATALLFADAPPSMTPRSTPGWTILKTV